MKKLLMTAAVLTCAASIVSAQTVTSANVVGYTKTAVTPGGLYMMTCNFETSATNTLLSVFGTSQLTQNDNYVNCDRVLMYDQATKVYQAWAQWTDGVFYKANDLAEWNSGIAGNPDIPLGTGFFLSTGPVSHDIIVSGEVVASSNQVIGVVSGNQIMAYPFSSGVNIQDTGFFNSGAAADDNYVNCDRIFTWNGSSYQAYAVWTDGVWYKANNLAEWNLGVVGAEDISLMGSFFYNAISPITYTETNTYLNAFE